MKHSIRKFSVIAALALALLLVAPQEASAGSGCIMGVIACVEVFLVSSANDYQIFFTDEPIATCVLYDQTNHIIAEFEVTCQPGPNT